MLAIHPGTDPKPAGMPTGTDPNQLVFIKSQHPSGDRPQASIGDRPQASRYANGDRPQPTCIYQKSAGTVPNLYLLAMSVPVGSVPVGMLANAGVGLLFRGGVLLGAANHDEQTCGDCCQLAAEAAGDEPTSITRAQTTQAPNNPDGRMPRAETPGRQHCDRTGCLFGRKSDRLNSVPGWNRPTPDYALIQSIVQ